MAGSIGLAGKAALRVGAGLVTVATPAACASIVATYEPSYMTLSLPGTVAGQVSREALLMLREAVAVRSSIGLGPGLGRAPDVIEIALDLYRHATIPMVIDADGLYALSMQRDRIGEHVGPRILTPHGGEFRRLVGDGALDVPAQRRLAPEWAAAHGVVLVLKGHQTLVTDGSRTAVNPSGNPGMATGGAGDVLTGMIGGLLAQRLSAWDAARLGVYLHGRAGDLAVEQLGMASLIASDLVDAIPRAFLEYDRLSS